MAIEIDSRVKIMVGAWSGRIGTVTYLWAPVTVDAKGSVVQSCIVTLDGADMHNTMLDVAFLRELIPGATDDKR